ncbi:carbohydrate-binding protein [bacterium]|nr:MAG: carbohydrate-binding protein [bacterium]
MKRTLVALSASLALAGLPLKTQLALAQQTTLTRSIDPRAGETKAQRDARMKWWREARYGLFIHWGLYSIPGGIWKDKPIGGASEHLMATGKVPVADYATLAPQFNPTQFDANRWAELAKRAGMKYVVITAKHHDGFALFSSQASTFDIQDATPFKRDPIAELAEACKKQGLAFGVYYSQAQDWHHAGGAAWVGQWDSAQKGDLHQYVRSVSAPQVKELLTKYNPAILWWDTPVDMSQEDIKAIMAPFAQAPNVITNNRLGNGVEGDTETPEQRIPSTGFKDRDWEVCMTINDSWGYKSLDVDYKSSESLLRNLIDITSKGGNYLLNVGPDGQGVIPSAEVERLETIGRWLKANGDSVYGTTANPFKRLSFEGRATVKGNRLYLNVFRWPDAGLKLEGLQTPVQSATVLATGQKLQLLKAVDGTVRLSKPMKLDEVSTTIMLQLAGAPLVSLPEVVLAPQTGGNYNLSANEATMEGDNIQVEGADGEGNIGYWTNPKDTVSWKISVPENQTKTYQVRLEYASEPGKTGSAVAIHLDGVASGITGTLASTASWQDYRPMTLQGSLKLTPGTHIVRIVPLSKPNYGVMNLRRVTLIPIP